MTNPAESEPLTSPKAGGRILAIDSLRGIAACSVMVLHFLNDAQGPLAYGRGSGIWQFGLGHCGVQLFFMISGFVIFQTLDRRPRVLDFAFARFTRLYPAFWVSIGLAYVLLQTFHYYPDPGRIYPVLSMTMMPRLFGARESVPIHWTLYVELQFYVLMALLTAFRLRRQIPAFLGAMVLLATFGAAGAVPGWPAAETAVPLLRHLHLFLFGICIYRWDDHSLTRHSLLLGLCAANTLVLGVVADAKPFSGIPYSIPVFVLAVVFALAARGRARWLEQPFLIGLGVISYSLYLMHEPFGDTFLIWSSRHGIPVFAALAIAFPAALALATLMTYAVERPSQRILLGWWKRREARRAAAIAPSPSGVAAP